MTYPRHLANCVIPAKAGTQADGSVVEDNIGKARVSMDGIEELTNVVFTDASAPAACIYTLEGAAAGGRSGAATASGGSRTAGNCFT